MKYQQKVLYFKQEIFCLCAESHAKRRRGDFKARYTAFSKPPGTHLSKSPECNEGRCLKRNHGNGSRLGSFAAGTFNSRGLPNGEFRPSALGSTVILSAINLHYCGEPSSKNLLQADVSKKRCRCFGYRRDS